MIPGQDLGMRLQAFLGWANNYAHMPYEKQQEMLWELGQIEIGLGTLVATNERVQKAIEPSVIELSSWLKQTQPNIHIPANLLTVVQTCRRQSRSIIDFFAQALLANSNNYLSRPSLLPEY
jgi:hypothetical protein